MTQDVRWKAKREEELVEKIMNIITLLKTALIPLLVNCET